MKQKIILIVISMLFVQMSFAQEFKNSVGVEVGGGGMLYSLNFERLTSRNFVARAGISYLQFNEKQTEKSLNVMSVPMSLSYLQNVFRNKHFLEIGIGAMDLITSGDLVEYKGVTDIFINPYLIVGYRYRPISQRWSFKSGFTPFYGTKSLTNPTDQGFMPFGSKIQVWGYIGLGYNF